MAKFLLIAALLLLIGGWYFSVAARYRQTIPIRRQLLSFIPLISLTAATTELIYGSIILQGADFQQELEVVPRLALPGLALTLIALATCWLGTPQSFFCVLLSTLIIGLLWWGSLVAL